MIISLGVLAGLLAKTVCPTLLWTLEITGCTPSGRSPHHGAPRLQAVHEAEGLGTVITTSWAGGLIVPEAPSLDLAATSDTGSSSTDNITSDTTPDIIITFITTVVANDIVRVRDGVTELTAHVITGARSGLPRFFWGSPRWGAAHIR
jgi:hypothetical protein